MTLAQAKSALETQQQAFTETATQPNTLDRNIVLAGYRDEIGRLQKFIAKPVKLKDPSPAKAAKPQMATS